MTARSAAVTRHSLCEGAPGRRRDHRARRGGVVGGWSQVVEPLGVHRRRRWVSRLSHPDRLAHRDGTTPRSCAFQMGNSGWRTCQRRVVCGPERDREVRELATGRHWTQRPPGPVSGNKAERKVRVVIRRVSLGLGSANQAFSIPVVAVVAQECQTTQVGESTRVVGRAGLPTGAWDNPREPSASIALDNGVELWRSDSSSMDSQS